MLTAITDLLSSIPDLVTGGVSGIAATSAAFDGLSPLRQLLAKIEANTQSLPDL